MQTVFFNIDPNRKNYLIVTIRPDGYAEIVHDAKTDDELADACDFWEYNGLSSLEVGQVADKSLFNDCFILRIS